MPIYDYPRWESAYNHRGYDCASESSCRMEKNPVYMIREKEVCFEKGNEPNPTLCMKQL